MTFLFSERIAILIKKFGLLLLITLIGLTIFNPAIALKAFSFSVSTIGNGFERVLKTAAIPAEAESQDITAGASSFDQALSGVAQNSFQIFTYCSEKINAHSYRSYVGYENRTNHELILQENYTIPTRKVSDAGLNPVKGSLKFSPGRVNHFLTIEGKIKDGKSEDITWFVKNYPVYEYDKSRKPVKELVPTSIKTAWINPNFDTPCTSTTGGASQTNPASFLNLTLTEEVTPFVYCAENAGKDKYNAVVGYTNKTGARVDLIESYFDKKERSVVHTYFDVKLGKNDFNQPDLAQNLSGPIKYLKAGDDKVAMTVEGYKKEHIKWTIRYIHSVSKQEITRTLRIAQEFYDTCPQMPIYSGGILGYEPGTITAKDPAQTPAQTTQTFSSNVLPQSTRSTQPANNTTRDSSTFQSQGVKTNSSNTGSSVFSQSVFHPQLTILPYLEPIPNTIQFPLSNNTQILGTLDFYTYCRNKYSNDYTENLVNTNGVNIWTCYNQNLNDYQSIDANDTCKVQYQNQQAYVIYNDHLSPFTWECGVESGGGNGGVDPLEPDPNVSFDEDDLSPNEYSEAYYDVNNSFFGLNIPYDLPELQSEYVNTANTMVSQTDSLVFGALTVNCSALNIVCNSRLLSALANLAQLLASFIWGLLKGIGQAVIDFFEFVKSLFDLGNTLTGIGTLIQSVFNDPSIISNLILDKMDSFNQKNIYQKAEEIGYLIGLVFTDVVIGLLTGGLIANLAGKIATMLGKVKSASQVAAKALNVADKFVGKTLKIGSNLTLPISKAGSVVGIAGSEAVSLVKNLSGQAFEKLLELIPDGALRDRLKRFRGFVEPCVGKTTCLVPQVLDDGSNLAQEVAKYLGKTIITDKGTITIPNDFIFEKAINKKGQVNGIRFRNPSGLEEIRVMNQVTEGKYLYPKGYIKRQNSFGNYLDINGNNLPPGVSRDEARSLTHFQIIT